MITKLKDQVINTLKEFPETRNSDIALMIQIWRKYYSQRVFIHEHEESIALVDLYELPREDNIKRIRAKLQEMALKRIANNQATGGEHWYLPTDEKIAKQRQIDSALWKKFLGYNHRTSQDQSNQLPNPVGVYGFYRIKDNEFLIDGKSGKKYKVVKSGEFWSCECEAFKYAFKTKTCKHIKAISKWLLDKEKIEVASKQNKMF